MKIKKPLIVILLGCLYCAAHAQTVTKDIAALRVLQQYGVPAQILRPYALLQDKSSRDDGRFLFEFDGDPCIHLLLDRDQWVIRSAGAALKRDITSYMFNPEDGQSALVISFGNDGFDTTDAMLAKSPGFTKITRGDGMVATAKVVWRRWSDNEHLYSDCTTILPAQDKKIKTSIHITANSEARRQSLENCLSSLKFPSAAEIGGMPVQKLARAMLLASDQWDLSELTSEMITYRDKDSDQIEFALLPAQSKPVDPRNLDQSRAAIRSQLAKNKEALVEAFPVEIKGVNAQWYVCKRRQDNLGFTYRTCVMIFTTKNTIKLGITCQETGFGGIPTTGMREALVEVILSTKADEAGKSSNGPYVKMHDPYDSKYDQGALYFDSDDKQWDKGMPDHPLTRARRKMQAIADALTIPDEVKHDALFAK